MPAKSLDLKLESLRQVRSDPCSDSSSQHLRRLLGDKSWLVVSEAARIIADHRLEGFNEALRSIWSRFVDSAKKDPGCRAKEAGLTALDALEILDSEPFLEAVCYRQLEPVAGGKVDTAGGVRVRAQFALFRQVHPDAALWAGYLMADADPQVRAAIARGLGVYGDRTTSALLVHKLVAGDEDPAVLSECAASLLLAADDFALSLLGSFLKGDDDLLREIAAVNLAQSKTPEVVSVLLQWLEDAAYDRDVGLGIRALGLSRLEPARGYLLDLVEAGSPFRARAAVEALSAHHYDEVLLARVRDAAGRSHVTGLVQLFERCFRGRGA